MTAELVNEWAWVHDLVDPDDSIRRRARVRHEELLAASRAEQWPRRWRYWERTIFGPLEMFINRDDNAAVRTWCAPFVLTYLRWEADRPDEWTPRLVHWGSPWGMKVALFRVLGRYGVPVEIRAGMGELLVAALRRPYRCKDWMYAQVVRDVWDERVDDAVAALAGADEPLTRQRARFVRYLVENPEQRVTRTSWKRWVG